MAAIGKVTGYSKGTVSLALRNHGSIRSATRRKIQEMAEKLGYQPNPLLASLGSRHFGARKTSGMPLAFLHFPHGTASDERILKTMIAHGQEYARKLGYQLDIYHGRNFKSGLHATRMLFARGVQGIIIPQYFQSKWLPGMDWGKFSVVGLGEGIADHNSPLPLLRATVDHFGIIRQAWEETWNRGYRKIGFLLFRIPHRPMEDEERWAAVQACLRRLPDKNRLLPFFSDLNGDKGPDLKALKAWVRRYQPDAVIGYNAWFLWSLIQLGFKIPQDFAFANLTKEPEVNVLSIPESGMKYMRFAPIQAGLELLDQQIRHHQHGLPLHPRTLTIHSEWLEGNTMPLKVSHAC